MNRIFLLGLFLISTVNAQDYFPTNSGVKSKELNYQAFTNATIYLSPTKSISKATLLELNGKVIAVGTNISLPKNTRVYDKTGLFIYPSFIDIHTTFGIQTPKRVSRSWRSAQYEASRDGYYWNDHILSDYNGIDDYSYDKKEAEQLRKV